MDRNLSKAELLGKLKAISQPKAHGMTQETLEKTLIDFMIEMLVKASPTLCFMTAGASTFAQADQVVSCKLFVQIAVADETGRPMQAKSRERELCFPGDQNCLDQGGLVAEDIWKSADTPDQVKSVLLEYADYIGRVSETDIPRKGGKIVRIGRFVGSAHCVRDTYFLYQKGTYRLIDSPSLEALSAEAGNCGDVGITLKAIGEPLLVTRFYGVVTAYRFGDDFALRKVCSERYRAPR
jgi:hypothetical protein